MIGPRASASGIRRWRAWRAATVAVTVLTLAALGHVAGGGASPAPVPGLLLTLAAGAAAYRLSGRRWTTRTLTAMVIGTQGAVHVLCGLFPADGAAVPVHDSLPGPLMLAGHALAAAAAVALLKHGEAALAALVEIVHARPRRQVALLLTSPVGPTVPAMVVRQRPVVRPRVVVHAWDVSRRGPPVAS